MTVTTECVLAATNDKAIKQNRWQFILFHQMAILGIVI